MSESPRVTVVVPTYNERRSLDELVKLICALEIKNLNIVVVDDNSPDGTGALADSLSKEYPLRVIHRKEKQGLGKAYMQAFSEIIALPTDKRPELIIQMDADLSHNPSDIPRFLECIQTCDLVLGSRYVPGVRIENWDLFRRMVSRLGNIYASLILGMPYHDLTSGYKCFRLKVLETINVTAVGSIGYNFQIEITYLAKKKGFRVCEIPIFFTERKTGKSKFNMGIILESFWKVLQLRFRK